MTPAVPADPPAVSLHAKSGRLVPGGVGGVTGGGDMSGPVRPDEAVPAETEAAGEVDAVHAVAHTTTAKMAAATVRSTGE